MDCSALELIAPDIWVTMDGSVGSFQLNQMTYSAVRRFEFATNEYVNDMAVVTLETAATETGKKDFIAVGTSIDRGEDLAVKGAVRLLTTAFDINLEPMS